MSKKLRIKAKKLPGEKITFTDKVLGVVAKIKSGHVLTYKQVAQLADSPRAYRAVGNILGHNHDLKIPCHRVIRQDGKIGGFNRGVEEKVRLLKKEKAILL